MSILLPTYNRGYLLGQCIESVLTQTYTNWELIIADDGSTDDTQINGEGYARKDARIKYHRNPTNRGLTRNRNLAISLSKGNLILFIEDDIIMEPDCLARLVETFTQLRDRNIKLGAIAPRLITARPEIDNLLKGRLSFSKGVFFYESYSQRIRMNRMHIPSMLNKWTGITYDNFDIDLDGAQETAKIHACSLFPRSIFKEVGGYSSIYEGGKASLEETDMCFRIANRGYKLYFQPKAVEYHQRAPAGGCGDGLTLSGYSYFLRNHFIFLVRNFGIRTCYMYPSFLLFIVSGVVKYLLARRSLSAAPEK